jgi:hypothetical protein
LVDIVGADGIARSHHIFQPEQRPLAVIDDGPNEELPLTLERNIVGALSRGERGYDNTDDRNCDDDAQGNEYAEARAILLGRVRSLTYAPQQRGGHHA